MPQEHSIAVLIILNRMCNLCRSPHKRLLVRESFDHKAWEMQHTMLSSTTIHKLVLAAIVIVHKSSSDFYYTNKAISEKCQISLEELNALELEFLNCIDFNITVDREEYNQYIHEVNKFYATNESSPEIQEILLSIDNESANSQQHINSLAGQLTQIEMTNQCQNMMGGLSKL